ncbi:CBS domain-containing protein [Knoellia aerolata]|uniref:CBS domain-containing protein n=1 Tax=Knoellia aerolata DSM 18566 TaxID=1385519 RepID=A0A0A0JU85_9MICO|nr:CBS domain-containing protein [Knoellia aerolata]KGN40703.1 hypothetical protein N801_12700 [Knoellia aerolata DSM 18566]
MLVADVMTSPALSLPLGAPLEEAIAILGRSRISSLPVVDEHGVVVGIVSEGDVLRDQLPRDPRAHLRASLPTLARDRTVDDLMTADPRCVTSATDSSEVAQTLAAKGWKSMPVVDDGGHLVGVVSRSDILRAMAVPDVELVAAIQQALAEAGLPEVTASVTGGHVTVHPDRSDLGPAAMAVAATVPGIRSVQLAP